MVAVYTGAGQSLGMAGDIIVEGAGSSSLCLRQASTITVMNNTDNDIAMYFLNPNYLEQVPMKTYQRNYRLVS